MSAARYSIGPLTTYADPGQLREWIVNAAPGHHCIYAIGPGLGEKAETARLAQQLAAEGKAELKQEKVERGFKYIIRKKESPSPPSRSAGEGAQAVDHFPHGSPGDRVHRLLCQCAEAGRPCPSYATIAEKAELNDRQAARYLVAVLERRGLVRVDRAVGRRVTVIGERENHV